ncbi:abortive infection AbiH-like protein [Arcicella aurantiaca]|uniref:Abortive infection AbiH-like protein n=1 Tax=Arcicella aurantiaca TaxID=591202 RepID=A0A316E8U8_9BACT|nr:AbiH family protein [Arcicella aurantiaca]PWK26785.1 abortive infection AbiH-like protein [Arcicella aurantiaca]
MKKTERNKLVIIGNGFDLAHRFETSYSDFIEWYKEDCMKRATENSHYTDDLIEITRVDSRNTLSQLKPKNSLLELQKDNNNNDIQLRYSHLLDRLIKLNSGFNWINIENEFYAYIVEIYKLHISDSSNVNNPTCIESLSLLNQKFNCLRNKLEEYLTIIQQNDIENLNPNFIQNFGNIVQDEWYNSFKNTDKKIVFLNFNYTNTIEHYTKNANTGNTKEELIYIHGKLNDPNNPIIFGYGDEIDEYYKKIEELNINSFLYHFKSFGYFKTNNYQKLLSFIESDLFDVEIVGHSCGLSDRVLLNTIFEHDNCEAIKIHYYENANGENDYTYKTQEISRHFNDKAKMRKRIVNFSECQALICK